MSCSSFNAELYCDKLNSAITSFLLSGNELTGANFDKNFDSFSSLIQKVIDKHASLKQVSSKQKKKIKTWTTKDIQYYMQRFALRHNHII